jgi:hypothetical protein
LSCLLFSINYTGGSHVINQNLSINGKNSGKCFVDIDSIACGLHQGDVPEDFIMIADGAFAYLFRPPYIGGDKHHDIKTELDGCPYYAIGNDG